MTRPPKKKPNPVVLRERETQWLKDGTPRRRFLSANERLEALVTHDVVRLERMRGRESDGLKLPVADFPAVVALVKAWATHRLGWDAFYGHFSGVGAPAWYHWSPVAGAKPRFLCFDPDRTREKLVGREEVRPAPDDASLGGWKQSARLVQVASSAAPGEVEVGAQYAQGTLRAVARMRELELHGRSMVVIEPGEDAFLAALAEHVVPPAPLVPAGSDYELSGAGTCGRCGKFSRPILVTKKRGGPSYCLICLEERAARGPAPYDPIPD